MSTSEDLISINSHLCATQEELENWFKESNRAIRSNYDSLMRKLYAAETIITQPGVSVAEIKRQLEELLGSEMSKQPLLFQKTPSLPCDQMDIVESFLKAHPPQASYGLQDEIGENSLSDEKLNEMSVDLGDCTHWVVVQFKRRELLFGSNFLVSPGVYVIVGGDRGKDVGKVKKVFTNKNDVPRSVNEGPGRVLCMAKPSEIKQLSEQREPENEALAWAQAAAQKHSLDMIIVDAEYQFDRRKLTLYYESFCRLDFRNLVRELYQKFHTRIWMEKVK